MPISAAEVARAISEAPANKAPGPDGLPADLLKKLPKIEVPLADLYNEWLQAGEIPQRAKEGTVTLLFKKGDPQDIKSYRRITLLNSASRPISSS